ncbi:MAG: DUF2812 domain-containing protein [Erysipelotrichaceae bacterium]|nr:DUF2812 domain-containing protein [Erysipelotrichaceae bacterium]
MNETKTIRKLFWVWDFEKEEKWLNRMAAEGWALVSVGFCSYTFEQSEPGEYIIRLEMHDSSDTPFISFMEETGAEYVGKMIKWIYFRRRSELGSFDLFSDIDSRIDHLKTIISMIRLLLVANTLIGVSNSINVTRIGWINLLAAALLAYGLGRLDEKKESLQNERLLRE